VRSSVRFSAEISGEGDREDIVERCSGMGDTWASEDFLDGGGILLAVTAGC
jgi:hypothetical protein